MKPFRFIPILAIIGLAAAGEAGPAEIVWKFYLKYSQSLVYTASTRAGEELVLPRIALSQGDAGSQAVVDALEGVRFLVPRADNPLEIRITLNTGGDGFEPSRQKTLFLNLGATVLVNGRTETSYRFPSGAPMTIAIPAAGLSSLLGRCGFSRSDDLVLAFDTGSAFTKDDIVTRNYTSGLSAEIGHLSTIVGSRTDILGLAPNSRMGPWHQIKMLFR